MVILEDWGCTKWQKLNFQFKIKILKKLSYSPLQNRLSLKNQYFIFILALDFVSMSNFTMKYEWFYNVLWNNIEFASYIYGEVITCKMNYFTFVVQPVEVWREGKKSGHASHQNLLPSLPDLGGGCMVSCYEVSQKYLIPFIFMYTLKDFCLGEKM